MLETHRKEQEKWRTVARQLWHEAEWVFTDALGKPVNPRFDYDEWKRLLRAAKVRDGRLHDARHTAATVLLILGIPDTAVDGVMGWEPGGAMRRRYQHLTDPVLKNIAGKLGHTLWGTPENGTDDGDDGPAEALVPVR
jgi:integrase